MSYILEALKKADRERNLGDVPDLESKHWGVRKTSYASRWPWMVAALLLFNAAMLVYLLGRDTNELSGQPGLNNNSPPDVHTQTSAAILEPLQPLEKPARERPREMRPKVDYPSPPVVTATPERTVAKPEKTSRVAEPEAPVAASVPESQMPEWSELSLEFRSGFALPHIDVHVYADEPARRFVLIDLKKYREGDTLSSGALLEKIEPGCIQLFYQGTRFRVDR